MTKETFIITIEVDTDVNYNFPEDPDSRGPWQRDATTAKYILQLIRGAIGRDELEEYYGIYAIDCARPTNSYKLEKLIAKAKEKPEKTVEEIFEDRKGPYPLPASGMTVEIQESLEAEFECEQEQDWQETLDAGDSK